MAVDPGPSGENAALYRKLLVAYISHVIDSEGIDYLSGIGGPAHPTALDRLSDEERQLLRDAAEEAARLSE
jgi:hypothetical protein